MKRSEAASLGKDQLIVVEAKLDDVLAEAATLISTLTRARVDANISAVVGQDALRSAGRAVNAILEAREAIVDTHHHLKTVRIQIGCGAMAIGDLQTKPGGDKKDDASVLREKNAKREAA